MTKSISRRTFLKKTVRGMVCGAAGSGLILKGCASKKEYDLIIKEVLVYDGLGKPAFSADLAVKGDTIAAVGEVSSQKGARVIHIRHLAVSPGFIDVHDHSSTGLLVNPNAESLVHQGITTAVSGNCGSSAFPVAEETLTEDRAFLKEQFGLDLDWRDINGFFSRLEKTGIALNYATLAGHGSIRGAAMGFNDRPPTPEEMEKMRRLLDECLRGGAFGLSTGLEYSPGSYAQPDEIIELCKVAARYGGVYATHMRDEGDRLLESLDESIDTAKRSGVKLQISHFKTAYPRNWGKISDALGRIEEAKKEGIDVFCDRYSYTAGATGLSFYFPLWAKQGTTEDFIRRLKDPALNGKLRTHLSEQEKKLGSWDKVVISDVVLEKNRGLQGKNILEAAKDGGKPPYEFMRDLLIEEKAQVGMITFMMSEDNLKRILAHPLVGVGCDGSVQAPYGVLGKGKPHPRNYGTFPRALGKYVREENVVSWEDMIRKMTSLPAQRFGFEKRGVIAPGCHADLVLFDPAQIADAATWVSPHQYPVGIEAVLVNGRIVVEKGEHTNQHPGRILRKKV